MPFPKPRSKAAESRRKALYIRAAWRDLRKKVLTRDVYTCRSCGSREQVDVHHIRFRSLGGENSLKNLAAICRECHAEIHAYRLNVGGTDANKKLTFVKARLLSGIPDGGGDVRTGGYRGMLHSRQRGAHP